MEEDKIVNREAWAELQHGSVAHLPMAYYIFQADKHRLKVETLNKEEKAEPIPPSFPVSPSSDGKRTKLEIFFLILSNLRSISIFLVDMKCILSSCSFNFFITIFFKN